MFQRLDNFWEKGFDASFENYKCTIQNELKELETVKTALGREFPQKAELDLVRENHDAVMRELQRMQDDAEYVGEWKPKTMGDIVPQNIDNNTISTQSNNAESGNGVSNGIQRLKM